MWMDDDEDKIDEVKLRQRKARAREIIQEARKSLPRTRKLWSKTAKKIIEKIIDSETRERRGDVQNLKSHLMKCGYPVCKQRLKDAERKLKEWLDGMDGRRADFIGELESILKLPKVRAVKYSRGKIQVFTDTIYIRYRGSVYEIGNFIIFLDIDRADIELKNLCSTHPSGHYHPYSALGDFCWGALGDSIFSALGQGEFAISVNYILQALQSAKGDNPGAVMDWKKVK